jgi:hypothetical protein
MKHPDRTNQIATPLDQLEHMRGICAVYIGMAPIFDRGAIIGFGDGNNRKVQLSETREAAARVLRDFVAPMERKPAQLRIEPRDQ